MLPDRVSNPGPLTYESGALPIALRGPASILKRERVGEGGNLLFQQNRVRKRQATKLPSFVKNPSSISFSFCCFQRR